MKATVLIDNLSHNECTPEWGLSIYIEYEGTHILLDTGASGKFAENAETLGIDLGRADFGVLSHAHYDHADGMPAFFEANKKALFYLRQGCGEGCYSKNGIFRKYIGMKKGILKEQRERIVYVEGDYEIRHGIRLIPHKENGVERKRELAAIGRKNRLYIRRGLCLCPDSFVHEQSLVLDTEKGLVIFNSCSHGGADRIIREVGEACPGKRLYAMVGGFHLYQTPEEEVRALAGRIRDTGISEIYTGHCTGNRAYHILKEELGDGVKQLEAGLVVEI